MGIAVFRIVEKEDKEQGIQFELMNQEFKRFFFQIDSIQEKDMVDKLGGFKFTMIKQYSKKYSNNN